MNTLILLNETEQALERVTHPGMHFRKVGKAVPVLSNKIQWDLRVLTLVERGSEAFPDAN